MEQKRTNDTVGSNDISSAALRRTGFGHQPVGITAVRHSYHATSYNIFWYLCLVAWIFLMLHVVPSFLLHERWEANLWILVRGLPSSYSLLLIGERSQRKSCALKSNTIFRSGNCMCISTVIKIARDQGTLMINSLFLWAKGMSYRIWPSWETLMKYSLAEHVLKARAGIGCLGSIFLYVVDQLCHVAWITSCCFWSLWCI